ncbi:MAG: preprotein translocase subunit YajC [Candidatus Nanopelagicales bacterium]
MEALLPLILLVAVFYLLILRPARKRQQESQQITRALAPGVEVMTAGGIFGTIRSVGEGEVTVEVAPGTTLRMVTGAIAKVVQPKSEAPQDPTGAGSDTEPTDEGLSGNQAS